MKSKRFFDLMLAIITMTILLGSCSTTKMSLSDLDNLKNQQPPAGKALVYIIRASSFAAAIDFKVTCDSNEIGVVPARRFIYAILDPGAHRFIGVAEKNTELYLTVQPDKIYFIEERAKMGIMSARNELVMLNETSGREKLKNCKLSGNCPAYNSSSSK
jgi:hypothetical protein